jgi:hypothetical protein
MGRRLADRGPRAAAGGGHRKECLAPCSGPTAAAPPLLHVPGLAPGPVAGAVVPVRGMGVGAERRPAKGRLGIGDERSPQGRAPIASTWHLDSS